MGDDLSWIIKDTYNTSTSRTHFNGPTNDVRIITIICLIVISISGIIGNALVFLSVWSEPKLRIVSSIFVINISIVGFLFSTLSIPVQIFHIAFKESHLATEGTTCIIFGYLDFTFLLATLANSIAIVVNRYIVVTKPKATYLKQYTNSRVVAWILLLWLLPAVMAAFGIPYYGYHDNVMACSLTSAREFYWYTVPLVGGPTAITFIVILALYNRIFKTVRQSRRRIRGLVVPKHSKSGDNKDHGLSANRRSSFGLFNIRSGLDLTEQRESKPDPTRTSAEAEKLSADCYKKDGESFGESSDKKRKPIPSGSSLHDDIKHMTAVSKQKHKHNKTVNIPGEVIFEYDDEERCDGVHDVDLHRVSPYKNKLHFPIHAYHVQRHSNTTTNITLQDDQLADSINQVPNKGGRTKRSLSITRDDDEGTIEIETKIHNKDQRNEDVCIPEKNIVIINTKNTATNNEIKLTFHLFIVFAVYCVLYLPMSIAYLLHYWWPVPPNTWMIFKLLASSYFALTWVLYGMFNRGIRKAYISILKCKRLRGRLIG